MKQRFRRPGAGWLLAWALFAASTAWATESTRVGDAAREADRNVGAVDFNKWQGNASKDITQADINRPTQVKAWTPAEITDAKAQLEAAANVVPSTTESRRLRAMMDNNPSPLPDDMHPVWYVEWLKRQSDVTAQFIKPPPNKIMIVDQDRLSKMTPAQKAALKVNYRKTTVCEKVISYTPIYKTITVYYPG